MEILNHAVRKRAKHEWGIGVADVGTMMAQRPVQPFIPTSVKGSLNSRFAPGTSDGTHLHPWLEIPIANLLLNILWDAIRGIDL